MQLNWVEWEVITQFCEQQTIPVPPKNKIVAIDRNQNPVGFMTNIQISSTTESLKFSKSVYDLIPTAISHPSKSVLGFLLFFEDNKLSAIEGYVYGEQWPLEDTSLRFDAAT